MKAERETQAVRERIAIGKVIANFPCNQTDSKETPPPHSEHEASRLGLYQQEASEIQSIFINPLRSANFRLKLAAIVLTLACASTLAVPTKAQRHHILEIVVSQAVHSAERAVPLLEQDIAKAVFASKALAKDHKTVNHASK